MTAYLLLFGSAFLAATILPFYSEVILIGMVREGAYPAWALLLAASAGNTLGAVVNWALGRYLLHFQDRKWFYFKTDQLNKWQGWFQKYGRWSLLMAWAPVVGDPLTFVAGVMRVPLLSFVVLVAIGKSLRYVAIIYFGEWTLGWWQ